MGRMRPLFLAVLLCLGLPAVAQEPILPPLPTDQVPIVGGVVNQAWDRLAPFLENESGEDLRTEEIDLEVVLRLVNVDYEIVGILFGGGKVEADVVTDVRLDFRAVSVARLDAALQATTGDADVSLNKTFGIPASRMALTAEEIRVVGGGVLLQAFQGFQESAATSMIEELLPGIVVLQADFRWQNTVPFHEARDGEPTIGLREPPLVLSVRVVLEYLDRLAVTEILASATAEDTPSEKREEASEKALKQRIEENQTLPPAERNAFTFLGYGQLLDLGLPIGWRMNLTFQVPSGFSVESASDEFVVSDDHRSATYFVDGSTRTTPFADAGVVTVSNRFLVTTTMLAVAVLVGLLARTVVEALVFAGQGGLAAMGRDRVAASKTGEAQAKGEDAVGVEPKVE